MMQILLFIAIVVLVAYVGLAIITVCGRAWSDFINKAKEVTSG